MALNVILEGNAARGVNENVATVENTEPGAYLRVKLEWDRNQDMSLRVYDANEGSYGADDNDPDNGEYVAVPPGSPSPFRIEIINEQGGPKDYTLTISTGAEPQ